jgi:hypothetical protein
MASAPARDPLADQTLGLRWAGPADPFGFLDLAQRRPGRADRENNSGSA